MDKNNGFDAALTALWEYEQNWDTGAVFPYAESDRLAMEGACERVREALEKARGSHLPTVSKILGALDGLLYAVEHHNECGGSHAEDMLEKAIQTAKDVLRAREQ